jgi:uncharacterized membrane protein
MFGGQDGTPPDESGYPSKPRNPGETIKRFSGYFRIYTPVLLVVAVLVILSTWARVLTPASPARRWIVFSLPGFLHMEA